MWRQWVILTVEMMGDVERVFNVEKTSAGYDG